MVFQPFFNLNFSLSFTWKEELRLKVSAGKIIKYHLNFRTKNVDKLFHKPKWNCRHHFVSTNAVSISCLEFTLPLQFCCKLTTLARKPVVVSLFFFSAIFKICVNRMTTIWFVQSVAFKFLEQEIIYKCCLATRIIPYCLPQCMSSTSLIDIKFAQLVYHTKCQNALEKSIQSVKKKWNHQVSSLWHISSDCFKDFKWCNWQLIIIAESSLK